MKKNNSVKHETQPEPIINHEAPYVDPNMEAIQHVEGGGPLRRVNMNQMPKPLKYFGYGIMILLILCSGAVVVSSMFN